jgi:hypothetical protein
LSHYPAQSAWPTSARGKVFALSFARQPRIAEISNTPADHVTTLLADQPGESAHFVRRQQRLVAIACWRTSVRVGPSGVVDAPCTLALGPLLDGWDERRKPLVVASRRTIRCDLGYEHVGMATAAMSQSATATVLAHRSRSEAPGRLSEATARPLARER